MRRSFFEDVYRTVKRIPRGRVTTYGRIAELTGNPAAVRAVGWALAALKGPETGVPWHRVVNSRGKVSLRAGQSPYLQRRLLESEGIVFSEGDVIDLELFGWPSDP